MSSIQDSKMSKEDMFETITICDNCNDCDDCDDSIDCDDSDNYCECSFPRFIIRDGYQSCRSCGLLDHYKGGNVAEWSEDEDDDEDCDDSEDEDDDNSEAEDCDDSEASSSLYPDDTNPQPQKHF